MTSPVIPTSRPSCPPALTSAWADSGIESWRALVNGTLDYWRGALARGTGPAQAAGDLARWWSLTAERRRPRWHSPHEVVLTSPIARLRDFSQGSRDRVVPTLVLPPQAGHDSCIVDYSPDQSQLQVIRAAGLTRLWSLDWVGATQKTKDATVDDYLDVLDRAVELLGGRVNLVGDCQGGWLATIYAALRPEATNTLTIAGAPVDFHAGEPVIGGYVDLLGRTGDMAFYEGVVRLGGGVLKGEVMLNGFVLIKPENELSKQLQLLVNLDDPGHVERYRHFEDWFKHTQDIPGAFYLWIVEHLFRDNELVRGELEVRGERADLGRIDCPLHLLAGANDHITPPPQVFATADHVSTARDRVTFGTTSGGHLGLFMGHEALRDHWPSIMADVYAASKPRARRRQAEARARSRAPRPARSIPAP
jgi:poly(3-hydroxyalkanoate) synthetase